MNIRLTYANVLDSQFTSRVCARKHVILSARETVISNELVDTTAREKAIPSILMRRTPCHFVETASSVKHTYTRTHTRVCVYI